MHTQQSKRGVMFANAIANGVSANAILAQLTTSFDEFRTKKNGEISELRNAIDEINSRSAAYNVMGDSNSIGSGINPERRARACAALTTFMRSGDVTAMKELVPQAAMSGDGGPDGGYSVPQEIDSVIQSQMISLSPMRQLAHVVTTGTSDYSKLVNRRGASSGWVSEREERPATDNPLLAKIAPPIGEIYAEPEITVRLAEDSQFDLEDFLKENVSDEFALQEGIGFTSGDGVEKPRGILSYETSTAADSARDFGTLQHVITGHASSFATTNPADALLNLVYSLKPRYRAGPGVGWQMNSATLNLVRQFKDDQKNYLWQKALIAGQPSTLCGYPVYEAEDMSDVGANAYPIAFGNWRRGYTIVDRSELKLLRDPFTKKGWIRFYFTKRTGGAVTDSNAIKLLKCSE